MRPPDFAAEDRRDDDDRAAAALAHVRHGQPRAADRGKQRLIECLLPVGVARRSSSAPRARPTLLTSTSMPPNSTTAASTTVFTPASVETSATAHATRRTSSRGRLCECSVGRLLQRLFTTRADHHVRAFGDQRLRRAKPKPAAPAGDDRDLASSDPLDSIAPLTVPVRSGRSASSRNRERPSGRCSCGGTPLRSAPAADRSARARRARAGCGSRTPARRLVGQ